MKFKLFDKELFFQFSPDGYTFSYNIINKKFIIPWNGGCECSQVIIGIDKDKTLYYGFKQLKDGVHVLKIFGAKPLHEPVHVLDLELIIEVKDEKNEMDK